MAKNNKSVPEASTSCTFPPDAMEVFKLGLAQDTLRQCISESYDSTMTALSLKRNPHLSEGGLTPATPAGSVLSGYAIERIEKLVEEIYKNIITNMSHLESIEFLTQVLESRKCPTDDCKKCRYYMPGNVDKCDTNRMLAEFLVNGEFVKAIRPKPISKPEES